MGWSSSAIQIRKLTDHGPPAEAAVHQSAGFGVPLRSAPVCGDVGEAGPKVVAARAREYRQDVGVDHGSADRDGRGGGAERADLPPQSIGQNLLELGHGANGRLLDARDCAGGGTAQPHRDGLLLRSRTATACRSITQLGP
jgi:hypothetical protein